VRTLRGPPPHSARPTPHRVGRALFCVPAAACTVRAVAHIDFVMHADFARIEADGVISILGGSFRSKLALLNTSLSVALIGRIVFDPDDSQAALAIRIAGPANGGVTEINGTADRPPDVPQGPDGAVTATFVARVALPVGSFGTHLIEARVGDGPAVRSWFEVVPPVHQTAVNVSGV